MTYIQRLLDSAALMSHRGILSLAAPALIPALGPQSPVLAADQRLGLFPGLAQPIEFGAMAEAPMPQVEAPAQAAAPAMPAAPTAAPPRVMSALQRLVEADPLPARPMARSAPRARAFDPEASRSGPLEVVAPLTALPTVTPPSAPPSAPKAAEARVSAPMPTQAPDLLTTRNPFAITSDQFQPVERPQPAPAPPMSLPAAAPRSVAAPLPLAVLLPQPVAPLRPAADAGTSPLARMPALPAAPPQLAPQRPAPPSAPPVARARPEAPSAPPAPAPNAMTAAAQSVIGPLAGRHGWTPRQEGL